ncbi:aldo/keto reductase [Asanoa iriomotensis]|uniref:Oxidoreductase n=1 Tax=Asanoa iriomotensis TaxID=234613 RepID=A0ABQ4C6L3_9ACTN|nr:aldo/keto reductase [Asanoa iriomotensis]GIF58416.1 oxidoreductase [Asanoa iriomotensis]
MSNETFHLGGDLPVRRLGFGSGQLAGPGYWRARLDTARSTTILRRAVERGVMLVDTADNYGPDVVEELIADALHPYPTGLVIATKCGVVRTGPDVWHHAGRPEQLRAQCEASLRRLRLDTIDLYQLHRIDPDVPLTEQLGALAELQQAGKIRHIGVDTVTAEELGRCLAEAEIASVQNRYNLIDRDSERVLAMCEARNIAFLPWFPLGKGLLATGGEGGVLRAIVEVAHRHGATASQIALAWLLHRASVILPTPGTASLAHLDENLDAAGIVLDADDLRQLDELTMPASS